MQSVYSTLRIIECTVYHRYIQNMTIICARIYWPFQGTNKLVKQKQTNSTNVSETSVSRWNGGGRPKYFRRKVPWSAYTPAILGSYGWIHGVTTCSELILKRFFLVGRSHCEAGHTFGVVQISSHRRLAGLHGLLAQVPQLVGRVGGVH